MGKKAVVAMITAVVVLVVIASVAVYAFGRGAVRMGENSSYERLPEELVFDEKSIDDINISLSACNLRIEEGEKFSIVTDSDAIRYKQKDRSLVIKEKTGIKAFFTHKETDILITLPKDYEINKLDLDVGAAVVDINKLKVSELKFEVGAGKADVSDLLVMCKADIDIGAGKLDISSGSINNLDIEIGTGKAQVNSALTGNADIEVGVGKLNYTIIGNKHDYKFKISKGIGEMRIDGRTASNGEHIGDGDNVIKVENGVGSVEIDFNYIRNGV